ncbi:MAG: tetratricopeptide repeat protein [Planctomycetaceae bacterium]|nr:tetratricopeptide repeat protein [Planctomycetaceae bacterium]
MALSAVGFLVVGAIAGRYLFPSDSRSSEGNPSSEQETAQAEQGSLDLISQELQSVNQLPFETEGIDPVTNTAAAVLREDGTSESAAHLTARQIAIADEHLRSGNFAMANRAYQLLRESATGSLHAALQYRLALCAETSGHYVEALDAYRSIANSRAPSEWIGASRLGEARCLAALGNHEALKADLLRLQLLDETAFPRDVRSELAHLLARDLWHEIAGQQSIDLLDDTVLAVTHWSPEPFQLLEELHHLEPRSTDDLRPEFTVLQNTEQHPDGIFLRIHTARSASVRELLQSLIHGCGMSVQFSRVADHQAASHQCLIHVNDRSLSLLLDGLTVPYGNLWTEDQGLVRIVTTRDVSPDELKQFQAEAAERMLRHSLLSYPEARQIGHTRIALGSLLFSQNRPADAAHLFRVQLESQPRSEVEAITGFNLGKCLMSVQDPVHALDAFTISLDASVSQADLRVSAYLYAGRIQMMLEQKQAAVMTLMRGLAVAEDTSLEAEAALMLAAAYLLNNNPQGANSVLVDRSELLRKPDLRPASAFASALARYRAAVLAEHREREAAGLVSAIAKFHPEKEFGAQWSCLLADACFDLGLTSVSIEHYALGIRSLPECPLRQETVLKLASVYRADNHLETATGLLRQLSPESASTVVDLAVLRQAEIHLDQDEPDLAITTARALFDDASDNELRRQALKVMGRAYEQKQNHRAAVYCYAGILPEHAGLRTPEAKQNSPAANAASMSPRE